MIFFEEVQFFSESSSEVLGRGLICRLNTQRMILEKFATALGGRGGAPSTLCIVK